MNSSKLRFVRTVTDIGCFLSSTAHNSLDKYLGEFVKDAFKIIEPELIEEERLNIECEVPGRVSVDGHKLIAEIRMYIDIPRTGERKSQVIFIELSYTCEIGLKGQGVFDGDFKEFVEHLLPWIFPKKLKPAKQEVDV